MTQIPDVDIYLPDAKHLIDHLETTVPIHRPGVVALASASALTSIAHSLAEIRDLLKGA